MVTYETLAILADIFYWSKHVLETYFFQGCIENFMN